jgi:hypothetical protein
MKIQIQMLDNSTKQCFAKIQQKFIDNLQN